MNVERFKQVFDTLDEEGQKNVLSQLSDEELMAVQNYKQEKTKTPSYIEALAGDVKVDPNQLQPGGIATPREAIEGTLYGMGATARDTGARIGQIARSVGEVSGLAEPGSRLAYTREHDREIAERNAFLSSQPQGFRGAAKVGGFVQSVAQVPVPGASSLLGRVGQGLGIGTLQYVPEGDKTLGLPSDIGNPLASGLVAGAAPYVMRGVAEAGKAVGNVVGGTFNALRGTPNPYSALKEQGYPLARQLTGLNDVQPPQAQKSAEFISNADEIAAATGKRPQALISQQFGSDRAAKAEAATAASPSITDKAFNERQRLITTSLESADDIAGKLNSGKITPERGGKLIAASQQRAIKNTWDNAEADYLSESKPVVDLFKSYGNRAVVGQKNQLAALEEIEKMAAVQGQSNEKVFSAIGRTMESISKTGNLKLDSALSRRGAFSRQSTGNKFLGIDDPATAKQAAMSMAKAVEADIAEAGIKISQRLGTPYPEEAIKKANAAYHAGAEKARSLEDNVFGSLLGKKNASFEDFTKAALKMPDSQFRSHMVALREVNPSIDKQMGRFLMDKARVESKTGAGAPATAAEIDPNKYFQVLSENRKFLNTFPPAQQKQVKAIMEQMNRLADRVGASGGGASADPIATVGSQGQAAVTQNAGFIARAVYRFVIGPMMHQALYTENGRRALLTVGRNYYKDVPPAAYIAAVKTLTDMENK